MADSGSTFPEQLEIISHSGSYPNMNGIYKFAAGETFNGLPVWRKDGGWVIKFTEQNNGLCWNVLQKSYTRARLKEDVAHPALATKKWTRNLDHHKREKPECKNCWINIMLSE